jgi:hypothetical protein
VRVLACRWGGCKVAAGPAATLMLPPHRCTRRQSQEVQILLWCQVWQATALFQWPAGNRWLPLVNCRPQANTHTLTLCLPGARLPGGCRYLWTRDQLAEPDSKVAGGVRIDVPTVSSGSGERRLLSSQAALVSMHLRPGCKLGSRPLHESGVCTTLSTRPPSHNMGAPARLNLLPCAALLAVPCLDAAAGGSSAGGCLPDGARFC